MAPSESRLHLTEQAGALRVGLGILRACEILSDNGILTGYCQQARHDTVLWGIGGDGNVGELILVRRGRLASARTCHPWQ